MASSAVVNATWKVPESLNEVPDYVDVNEKNTWLAFLFVFLTPFLFNVVPMWEYNTKSMSNMFGSAKLGCIVFGVGHIIVSNTRNFFFMRAVDSQAQCQTPFDETLMIIGYVVQAVGGMFVITSFLRLGFFGTWQGDHFGILLSEKVTGFPFSVLEHPMYDGAFLIFLGMAIDKRSIIGVVLACWVHFTYRVAVRFEGPFTDMIYAQAEANKKKGTAKSN